MPGRLFVHRVGAHAHLDLMRLPPRALMVRLGGACPNSVPRSAPPPRSVNSAAPRKLRPSPPWTSMNAGTDRPRSRRHACTLASHPAGCEHRPFRESPPRRRPRDSSGRVASIGDCSPGWLRPQSSEPWRAATSPECYRSRPCSWPSPRCSSTRVRPGAMEAVNRASEGFLGSTPRSTSRCLVGLVIGLLGGRRLILGCPQNAGPAEARGRGSGSRRRHEPHRRGRRGAAGLLGHLPTAAPDWDLPVLGAAASVPGALLGARLTGRLSEVQLVRASGVALLVAGIAAAAQAVL